MVIKSDGAKIQGQGCKAPKAYTFKYYIKHKGIFLLNIIVNLHAVIINNTKIPCILYSVSPSEEIWKIIEQYHNQDTDIDTIQQPYSGFHQRDTILKIMCHKR